MTNANVGGVLRCPLTLEPMIEDAMKLNCEHYFSEKGLQDLFISKNISYNFEKMEEILSRNELKCPSCSERITTIDSAYKYKNTIKSLAKSAGIEPEGVFSELNLDSKEALATLSQPVKISDIVPVEKVTTESMTPEQIIECRTPENLNSEVKAEKQKRVENDWNYIMSEHDLDKTRYGMECLSYRSMIGDTAMEALAFREKDYLDCFRYACLTRVKRAVVIPFLALLGCSEGCCEGFYSTCCCCLGCLMGSVDNNNDRRQRYDKIADDYCILSRDCCRLSSANCLECTILALCCLANCCAPEVLDAQGQIKSFHYLEKIRGDARNKLGSSCEDIFG